MDKQTDTLITREYHPAITRNKLLIYPTDWLNYKIIM